MRDDLAELKARIIHALDVAELLDLLDMELADLVDLLDEQIEENFSRLDKACR